MQARQETPSDGLKSRDLSKGTDLLQWALQKMSPHLIVGRRNEAMSTVFINLLIQSSLCYDFTFGSDDAAQRD